jgi:hypothetical protein
MQNYVTICYRFGLSLKNEVLSSNMLVNPEKYKINLNAEDKEKLKEAVVLFEKGLNLTEDHSLLAAIFNELRAIYNAFGVPDSLAVFVEKLKSKKDLSMVHFFRGQLLLDKLKLSKNIPEKEKQIVGQEIENEFKKIPKKSEKELINRYIGLLDLYNEIGDSQKKDLLVEELLEQPKIFGYVYMYNYDFVKDTALSIYLLKKWLEVNPYDKQAQTLLNSLSAYSHN